MARRLPGAAEAGLERSCETGRSGWLRSRVLGDGVELLQAWFAGRGYDPHRHDTYAIGLTDVGVQAFDYRGAARTSTPGQVVVLHPDELHDGRAGTPAGFGYRIVYVSPTRIRDAARAIRGRAGALPFVREPVMASEALAHAVASAFRLPPEPLAEDSLLVALAAALIDADPSWSSASPVRLDPGAIARARFAPCPGSWSVPIWTFFHSHRLPQAMPPTSGSSASGWRMRMATRRTRPHRACRRCSRPR